MTTNNGIKNRVPVEGNRISGRNTQGVKVMNLTTGDLLVDVARVVKEDEAENGDGDADDEDAPRPAAKPRKAPAKRKKKCRGPPPGGAGGGGGARRGGGPSAAAFVGAMNAFLEPRK